MKKLLSIALLAVCASGCAVFSPNRHQVPDPVVGMNIEDFKLAYPRASLVYLARDTSSYEVSKAANDVFTDSDFYHFAGNKLFKFEKKTHYFNKSTVTIETPKEQKN
ncbi:hypothetical protein GJU39_05695 [Pedobacter petrophilus]|uniref:Lipoprotein n=1 Tax=Pedobacter petrophilus TaxID=1908241 RepID=A0A7K0FVJ7_9SPHI|nr:hypothetical protein [Pedobacter petrophilus]MRX75578.1 hypothetical protein [Pedobacter petrophilus]